MPSEVLDANAANLMAVFQSLGCHIRNVKQRSRASRNRRRAEVVQLVSPLSISPRLAWSDEVPRAIHFVHETTSDASSVAIRVGRRLP
jgi:hypothetical protein